MSRSTESDLDRSLHASVLKREAQKERRRRAEAKEEESYHNIGSGGEMTKQKLKEIIESDRRMYYRTEELNDKLYIHYKGWNKIQNLEGFTGLRVLYAECNAFDRIEGLTTCTNLRSLFLQENCIKQISGLETLHSLWNLNLSSNFIERIEGLNHITTLNTLTIAKNKIGFNGVEDVEHLITSSVSSLDIQDNKLADPDILPDVFMKMKDLRVLYLKGNACCKAIPNYRKTTTACLKNLKYLDDRPVFEDDRRAAEAFNRGGLEEERNERKKIREEKANQHKRNMDLFNQMIENSRREARERKEMRAEDKYTDDTDPVESREKRIKRLHQEWEEKNPELLVNEVDEICKKKLEQEREGERRKAQSVSGDASSSADTAAPEDTEDSVPPLSSKDGDDEKDGEKKPEDNRKLVYEDIWDDAPSPWSRTPLKQELPTTPQLNETPENFKPWVGPGKAMADLSEEEITRRAIERKKAAEANEKAQGIFKPQRQKPAMTEQRAQELADEEQKAIEEIAGDDFKPNWYSRYREKAGAIEREINSAMYAANAPKAKANEASGASSTDVPVPSSQGPAPADEIINVPAPKGNTKFAPPPRGKPAAPAPAPNQNELDEMD